MIKSMTGFGRAEVQDTERKFTVEIKSVNHRYLDFNIRIPKKLSFFENAIRTLLKNYMQRGKVDVFITYEDFTQANVVLQYKKEMAEKYLEYFQQMADQFGLENDMTVSKLGRCPEVFMMEESTVDEKEMWSLLEKALKSASEQFVATRQIEGENLLADIYEKLNGMLEKVRQVEVRSPQIISEYRAKLEEKMKEVLADTQIEESRIASEVIIFADKICTDEETVRLKSHIEHMKEVLKDGAGIGRKLDFIAQEMNREANTILSKANDLEVSNIAIDLKTEIEKVREQIQNIE
ncbi:MAG: YicC family protein [Clostridia bacterium]|nr:YicC family protein [Clostridia bacterium]NCC43685.1 YicC family protein [Clostridia bacterium]